MTMRIVWSTIDVSDFSRAGVEGEGRNWAVRVRSCEVMAAVRVLRAVGEERMWERRRMRVEARQLLSAAGTAVGC